MPPREQDNPDAGARRRWRVPPPLVRDPAAGGPVGIAVIEEIPTPFGTVLWSLLRAVLLWSDADPEARDTLFPLGLGERRRREARDTASDDDADVLPSLDRLIRVLERGATADPDLLGAACARIAAWAGEAGHTRTSTEFLQLAALVDPGEGRHPLAVARQLLEAGKTARAESWLQRAVGMSRRRKDWEPYIDAYVLHGHMMIERGALPAARTSLLKALRRSLRQGNRSQEASVRHASFLLEASSGDLTAAAREALAAVDALSPDHPHLPIFALELADILARRGAHRDAFDLLIPIQKRLAEADRARALGLLALSAGALGERGAFRRAHQALDRLWTAPGSAEPWADATSGALALGNPAQSRKLAERAEAMARRMGESLERFGASALLEAQAAETPQADIEPGMDRERAVVLQSFREVAHEVRGLLSMNIRPTLHTEGRAS
jgi:tetratricopeptide (TPR) repeat protein